MSEYIVSYDIAVKLKEKGFPMPKRVIFGIYEDDKSFRLRQVRPPFIQREVIAPTISLVLRWLREVKKIFVAINIGYCYESDEIPFPTNHKMEPILKGYYYGIWELDNLNDKNARSEYFEDYEQAAIAGIEYVVDNLI